MRARTHRGRQEVGWALSVSLLAHFFLAAVFFRWVKDTGPPANRGTASYLAAAPAQALDVDGEPELAFVELLPAVQESPPPIAPDPNAVSGDETRRVLDLSSPRIGDSVSRAAPAPDSGNNAGRAPDGEPAFRRDRQTAKASLTDGSTRYQAARLRTARTSSSPQAERRETQVGVADVVRSGRQAATVPVPEEIQRVVGDEQEAVRAPTEAERTADVAITGDAELSGEGGLLVTKGSRSFDAQALGPARDVADLRAASNVRSPAPIEYSAPSATGPRQGEAGRGVAPVPGAVAVPSAGVSPTVRGAVVAMPRGDEVALSTVAEVRNRHEREIQRRASRVLRFPKRMALMLEQGETIIEFVVASSGRVAGPVRVVKSSGFAEFDDEAVSAVQRAAPFPAMAGALTVKMRVPFENPVVR